MTKMQGKMRVLRVNGHEEVSLMSAPPTLERLQKAVGGYIEAVPLFDSYDGDPCVVYCNEEGKLQQLAVNAKATRAWADQGQTADILVGDIVILTGNPEFMEQL